ncbi:integration host factor subunit beta [Candidatus Fermentibacteria bacterium]|nr:integration host factor subunit beta [Candidatus Fermentibacteria bacterium]
MTKADLVSGIAESLQNEHDLTKKQVAAVVNQFFDEVRQAMIAHKHIEIRGFGTFKVVERNRRKARNPHTGEPVMVPKRHVPVFKPSKAVKEKVAR